MNIICDLNFEKRKEMHTINTKLIKLKSLIDKNSNGRVGIENGMRL